MDQTIRVLLADRHQLLHVGVELIIKNAQDMAYVGGVTTSDDVLHRCCRHQPHVLLIALNVVAGSVIEFIVALRQACADTKLLALLVEGDEACVRTLLASGVNGCVLKSTHPGHLPDAIRCVAQGEIWLGYPLLERLLIAQKPLATTELLNHRERQILEMLAAEKTDREMAQMLHVGERTIRRLLQNLYLKLGVQSRVGAAYEAGRRSTFVPNAP